MKGQIKQSGKRAGACWWLFAAVLMLIAVAANQYYASLAWGLRATAWLLVVAVLSVVAMQTVEGRSFVAFLGKVRGELRKVVWPARQETVNSTIMVMIMVCISAFVLWALDSLLLRAFTWLTGQGGA